MESVYALRYQVYCVDRRFLPAEQFPDGLERDEFDHQSSHFCAIDRYQCVVGAVRMVRPTLARRFPFQDHCATLFDDAMLPHHGVSAEISRLVVDRNYRRRANDLPEGISVYLEDQKPLPEGMERRANRPEIVLGLYKALYQHSRREGVRYWYAAMERSLARALMRFNFQFKPIGPEVDYFGPVAPYLASLEELERCVGSSNPELLRWFQEE